MNKTTKEHIDWRDTLRRLAPYLILFLLGALVLCGWLYEPLR
jgi:hypothetical protein